MIHEQEKSGGENREQGEQGGTVYLLIILILVNPTCSSIVC